jgi:hypothetical protein
MTTTTKIQQKIGKFFKQLVEQKEDQRSPPERYNSRYTHRTYMPRW